MMLSFAKLGLLVATAPKSAVDWDPPELLPNWWQGGANASTSRTTNCNVNNTRNCYIMFLPYAGGGRSNNAMIGLKWAALRAVASTPQRTVVITRDDWHGEFGGILDAFDLLAATRSWICLHVLDEHPKYAHVDVFSVDEVFHTRPAELLNLAGAHISELRFSAIFTSQLLLRPRLDVRTHIELIERELGLHLVQTYIGVHLRSLEGSCVNRLRAGRGLADFARIVLHGNHSVSATDVCTMSDAYLDACMLSFNMPRTAPMVIAFDGQNKARIRQLKARYNVRIPSDLPWHAVLRSGHGQRNVKPVFIDMLLMLRAPAFVGNPASTLSANVAAVRTYARADAKTNLIPAPQPPGTRKPQRRPPKFEKVTDYFSVAQAATP